MTTNAAPKVSVVIPAYKHERFILATLDSVFQQTFQDFEVIVVNDGSPDSTEELLAPLAASGRIRYVRQPNGGQASARNRGLREASGRYIAFLDDDDLWPPDKLQWQVDVLENSEDRVGVIGGGIEIIDEEGKLTNRSTLADGWMTYRELFRGAPFWSPGQTLIRRSVLIECAGLRENIWGADDYDLWLRLARKAPLRTSTKIGLCYRLHGGNASRQRIRMLRNIVLVLNEHLAQIPEFSERAACRRDAFRWLYDYIGHQWVDEAKRAGRGLRAGEFLFPVWQLRRFLPSALNDSQLAARMAKDWIPGRFR